MNLERSYGSLVTDQATTKTEVKYEGEILVSICHRVFSFRVQRTFLPTDRIMVSAQLYNR